MEDYVAVAKTSDIPEGRGKAFRIRGIGIAVFNDNGTFYATSDLCAHAMGPLGKGRIKDGVAVCPIHGYTYDAKTGACQTDMNLSIPVYDVVVEGGEVRVKC